MASEKFNITVGSKVKTVYTTEAVEKLQGGYLPLSGGTMTGYITSPSSPTSSTFAAVIVAPSSAGDLSFSTQDGDARLQADRNLLLNSNSQVSVTSQDLVVKRVGSATLGDTSVALLGDLKGKVSRSGDTMSGQLDMSDNLVVNLPAPIKDGDAANKKYVDDMAGGGDDKVNVVEDDTKTGGHSEIVHDGNDITIQQYNSSTKVGGVVRVAEDATSLRKSNSSNAAVLSVKPNDATLTFPLGSRATLTDSSILTKADLATATGYVPITASSDPEITRVLNSGTQITLSYENMSKPNAITRMALGKDSINLRYATDDYMVGSTVSLTGTDAQLVFDGTRASLTDGSILTKADTSTYVPVKAGNSTITNSSSAVSMECKDIASTERGLMYLSSMGFQMTVRDSASSNHGIGADAYGASLLSGGTTSITLNVADDVRILVSGTPRTIVDNSVMTKVDVLDVIAGATTDITDSPTQTSAFTGNGSIRRYGKVVSLTVSYTAAKDVQAGNSIGEIAPADTKNQYLPFGVVYVGGTYDMVISITGGMFTQTGCRTGDVISFTTSWIMK